MPLELELDIPDSRELRVTLPPDAPTGRVRVTVEPVPTATRPALPPRPLHPKLAREYDAFVALLPQLLTTHRGRYVAVHDGAVIADADSSVAVLAAAERSHPGAFPLAAFVTDRSQSPERLPSVRRPRG